MEFTNPFDNPQGRFYILQNSQQQFSLWPAQCSLPAGWRVLCEPQPQEECNAPACGELADINPGALRAIRSDQ